jgi:hypothetical protein
MANSKDSFVKFSDMEDFEAVLSDFIESEYMYNFSDSYFEVEQEHKSKCRKNKEKTSKIVAM